jgi:hypothetical protein
MLLRDVVRGGFATGTSFKDFWVSWVARCLGGGGRGMDVTLLTET